jgi:hypothetical protein
MTRSEFEQRRRALEAQLAADVELLRAAHETRVRALESLWLAEGEEEAASPIEGPVAASVPPPGADHSPAPVPIGTQTGTQSETQTGTQKPSVEAGPVRKGYGEVSDDLEAALTRLPEVFDKAALLRELGYEPARSTFYRALEGMLRDRKILIETYSNGRTRTTYRKARNQGRREA